MKVTSVRVKKIDNNSKLKAIVSILLDNCLAIHDIKIIQGDNGLFLSMPSKKLSSGKYMDLVHPINPTLRNTLEKEIFLEYNK